MIFFLLSQWIFPQIEQKRVGLPGSRTQLKSFRPLSIYMLHQGFDRELPLPKNSPHRTGPQCSTNLEGKADHSLALRFRIPLRPDQGRHATKTNTQEKISQLWADECSELSWFLVAVLGRYSSVIYFVSEISAQKEDGTAGRNRVMSISLKTNSPTWISQL